MSMLTHSHVWHKDTWTTYMMLFLRAVLPGEAVLVGSLGDVLYNDS